METDSSFIRHWDDVVFENRNKAYGAYRLRAAYAQRLLLGLAVTLTVVALVLFLQDTSGDTKNKEEILPPLSDDRIKFTEPPVFEKKTHSSGPIEERRTNEKDRKLVVTREEFEETAPEPEADFVFSGDELALGQVSSLDGISTIALPEPGNVVEAPLREFAEVMPHYEGGVEAMMKFIQKKIRYPRAPRQLGIDGTVYVRFVVNGDGTVSDVEILKGVHPDYDKEAMRVISLLPSWKGGRHNGRPVSVRMVLPIKFNLRK
jgi:protein TonB